MRSFADGHLIRELAGAVAAVHVYFAEDMNVGLFPAAPNFRWFLNGVQWPFAFRGWNTPRELLIFTPHPFVTSDLTDVQFNGDPNLQTALGRVIAPWPRVRVRYGPEWWSQHEDLFV